MFGTPTAVSRRIHVSERHPDRSELATGVERSRPGIEQPRSLDFARELTPLGMTGGVRSHIDPQATRCIAWRAGSWSSACTLLFRIWSAERQPVRADILASIVG